MVAQNPTFDTLPVALTVYKSASSPLSKAYRLAGDGRIEKKAAAHMTAGTARLVEVPFSGLADLFDSLGPDEATGYGLFDAAQARIVVDKKANPPALLARTKEFCRYRARPGVLMLDHDPHPRGASMQPAELLAALADIVPGSADAAALIRASVSAGVRIAGQEPAPASAGFHIYMPVLDASDIPRFGAVLVRRLWLARHGYIALARNGALLVRTCIDGAVFAGERLDFTGRPVIGDGLEWTPPAAEYRHGGYLDTAALPDLSDAESAAYDALVAAAKTAAQPDADKQHAAWLADHGASMRAAGVPEDRITTRLASMRPGATVDVHPDWPLHFANAKLGLVTAGEVLADPRRFDGEALADPVEGTDYGVSTARFYANLPDGRPVINSMAHGGALYFLSSPAHDTAPAAPRILDGMRILGEFRADGLLCIAEDEQSAAAIHEHTGMPVAIAGASSRLWKAAHALRDAFPRLRLLLCGSVNTADKARAAAFSLTGGSYWCVPDFERPGADELTAAAIGLMKKPPVEGETIPTVFLKDAARDLRARDRRRIAEESPATFADLAAWDAGAERVAQQIKAAVGCIGVIKIRAGKLSSIVERAEKETLFAGAEYYERVGALVRPVHQDRARCADGVSIPAGALVLTPVTLPWLNVQFSRAATWLKYSRDDGDWKPADPPTKYAETLMHLAGEWRAPVLAGIVECPTLRRDGSLLTASGYDKQSGLYLNYSGGPVIVPDAPTRADALAALAILKEPFSEFQFYEGDIDLSVVLAGLLTAVARRSLRTAPLFAIDAPVMGSGKGLIVNTIATIATGRAAPAISQGKDEAEDEKRLGALLMQGVPLLNIDNIERDLAGDLLCSALTETSIAVRILGKSEVPYMPSDVAMFATGNNLRARGDMVRRMLVCRIDPACERPDGRIFTRNLSEWVPANRARLLSAALTLLRAYIVAGKPAQDIGPYGSFEEWSGLVRSCLVWAGMPDPCLTRARLEADDEVSSSLRDILGLWHAHLGTGGHTAAEVATQASMPGREDLHAALLEVAVSKRDPEKVDALRLGHWLKRNKGRVSSGVRLEKAGEDTHSKTTYWRVLSLQTSKSAGDAGIAGIVSPWREKKWKTIETVGESNFNWNGVEQYPQLPALPAKSQTVEERPPPSPPTGEVAKPPTPPAEPVHVVHVVHVDPLSTLPARGVTPPADGLISHRTCGTCRHLAGEHCRSRSEFIEHPSVGSCKRWEARGRIVRSEVRS
jgi:hypothetical protein